MIDFSEGTKRGLVKKSLSLLLALLLIMGIGFTYSITSAIAQPEDSTAGVESVTVTPKALSLEQGDSYTFKAEVKVDGEIDPDQTVTWTVTGGNGDTAITTDGVLTVDVAETAPYLKVRATSTQDSDKYGEAVVVLVVTGEAALEIDGVYYLVTAENLRWFSTQVRSVNPSIHGVLVNDINLGDSWTPIGTSTSGQRFTGQFDGQGHTVTLTLVTTTSYTGLFGYVGSGGLVKDVKVSGSVTGGASTAGVVGYLNGGTVQNCSNQAAVSSTATGSASTGGASTGGVVGYLNGGTVQNCSNQAAVSSSPTVSAANSFGGIVGYMTGNSSISGCANTGAIQTYFHVGGIIGQIGGGTSTKTISGCFNSGSVNATSTVTIASTTYGAGGIVGFGASNFVLEKCYNRAEISGSVYNVGGIVGNCNNANGLVQNCYNLGKIESSYPTTATNPGRAGGLAGNTIGALLNSYNAGKVTVAKGDYIGGIAGNVTGTAAKENLYYLKDTAGKAIGNVEEDYLEEDASYANVGNFSEVNAEFINKINGKETDYWGREFTAAENGQNDGYPVLRIFTEDDVVWEELKIFASPAKTVYVENDVFKPAGMLVLACYDDDTAAIISGYTYAATPLALGTEYVSISYQGKSIDQPITVRPLPEQKEDDDKLYYQLRDEVDLRWFSEQVGENGNLGINGVLLNDMEISESADWWTGIGGSTRFTGWFDGDGHTVKLNNNAYGLFRMIGAGALVKNVTVSGSISGTDVGGVATSSYGTIKNCVNEAQITSTGTAVLSGGNAGIVNRLYGGGIVEDCVNKGQVIGQSSGQNGGIVAVTTSGVKMTITGCINEGDVSGADNIGGIVGSNAGTLSLDNSVNRGEISGTNYIGGIVGSNGGTLDVEKTFNQGKVTATSTVTELSYGVGGIVGTSTGAGAIEQCYNSGDVTGSVMNVGGIIGYTSSSDTKVVDCYNTGDVQSSSASGTATVGGIAGQFYMPAATLKNTYNSGNVSFEENSSASTYIGGVIGYTASLPNIANNYYLENGELLGIGYTNVGAVSKANCVKVTAADLDMEKLAADLGDNFKAVAKSILLIWQTDSEDPVDPADPEVMGKYSITSADNLAYQSGVTSKGIIVLTVNENFTGEQDFSLEITPVKEHEGEETIVFTHFRNGVLIGLSKIVADFDDLETENPSVKLVVQPEDIVKVYIIDVLNNALDFNPTILQ